MRKNYIFIISIISIIITDVTGRKQKGKSSGSSGFMRDSLECDEAFGRMVSSDELETK